MKNSVSPAVVGVSVVVLIAIIVLLGFKFLGKSNAQAAVGDKNISAHEAYLKSVRDGTPRPGLEQDHGHKPATNNPGN